MTRRYFIRASLGILVAATLVVLVFTSRDYRVQITSRDFSSERPGRITLYPFLRGAFGGKILLGEEKPIDMLLAGIPGRGNPAPNLTDTVMIARLDPRRKSLTLISLPRDLVVKIPGSEIYTRLNALYELGEAGRHGRGIEFLQAAMEEITGIRPTRYALVDLSVVRDTVDALGGVNILLKETIFDPLFPGESFSYESFRLEKGWRYLDGEVATKFIRTRYGPGADFSRMQRQQQLIEAVKQKVAGLSFVWDLPVFLDIFESVNQNVETDFSSAELAALFEFGKSLRAENIRTVLLDADPRKNILTTGDFWFGTERAAIVKPIAGIGEYEDIRAYVQKVLKQ